MSPRHLYNNWIAKLLFCRKPKGAQWAFTLGRTVRYRYPDDGDKVLRNHENIHVGQFAKLGVVRFLWQYFFTEWGVPYREKSLEKEAYGHQHDLTYPRRVYGVIDNHTEGDTK